MESLKLKVMGMTCDHCVQTILKAVGEISGVREVKVDLEQKEVSVDVERNQVNLETISSKIVEVGYEVVEEKG